MFKHAVKLLFNKSARGSAFRFFSKSSSLQSYNYWFLIHDFNILARGGIVITIKLVQNALTVEHDSW